MQDYRSRIKSSRFEFIRKHRTTRNINDLQNGRSFDQRILGIVSENRFLSTVIEIETGLLCTVKQIEQNAGNAVSYVCRDTVAVDISCSLGKAFGNRNIIRRIKESVSVSFKIDQRCIFRNVAFFSQYMDRVMHVADSVLGSNVYIDDIVAHVQILVAVDNNRSPEIVCKYRDLNFRNGTLNGTAVFRNVGIELRSNRRSSDLQRSECGIAR